MKGHRISAEVVQSGQVSLRLRMRSMKVNSIPSPPANLTRLTTGRTHTLETRQLMIPQLWTEDRQTLDLIATGGIRVPRLRLSAGVTPDPHKSLRKTRVFVNEIPTQVAAATILYLLCSQVILAALSICNIDWCFLKAFCFWVFCMHIFFTYCAF